MGYYSTYDIIEIEGLLKAELENDIHNEVVAVVSYGEPLICLIEESCKWYDHADDLAIISRNYPDTLIVVQAVGEDGEQWRVYAKNGKAVRVDPEITYTAPTNFPEADPAALAKIETINRKRAKKEKLEKELKKLQEELDNLS